MADFLKSTKWTWLLYLSIIGCFIFVGEQRISEEEAVLYATHEVATSLFVPYQELTIQTTKDYFWSYAITFEHGEVEEDYLVPVFPFFFEKGEGKLEELKELYKEEFNSYEY